MESLLFAIASYTLVLSLLTILLFHFLSSLKAAASDDRPRLPPGNKGWPVIGETIAFIKTFRKLETEKFILERMATHSPHVFTTSILGEPVAVLCGATGSKFLFSNSNKLVAKWQISGALRRIFPEEGLIAYNDHKAALHSFVVKLDSLRSLVPVMDVFACRHFESHWQQLEVKVYPLAKMYALGLASRLFLSIEDDEVVEKLMHPMESLSTGIVSLPINLPGTPLNRALKAATALKLQILQIVRYQRMLLMDSSSDSGQPQNLLTCFLQVSDDDMAVATSILGMLLAGHDTTTSILCIIFKVLADYPHVYRRVYQENMEVAAKKESGEKLNWEDTQKLNYTWNVAREVMRLYSPAALLSREAITDFTYAGYHIPKGFKLITSICATHKDPKYFSEPEKFEPSRFDENGPMPYTYMPFGGGTTMCPGRNSAQLSMLVFIHNAVKRFKWETLIPDEKIIVSLAPKPAEDLPVLIHPHAR